MLWHRQKNPSPIYFIYAVVHSMVTWFTHLSYSGKTADPRWESSSSSIVKPLQLTWEHTKNRHVRHQGVEYVDKTCITLRRSKSESRWQMRRRRRSRRKHSRRREWMELAGRNCVCRRRRKISAMTDRSHKEASSCHPCGLSVSLSEERWEERLIQEIATMACVGGGVRLGDTIFAHCLWLNFECWLFL